MLLKRHRKGGKVRELTMIELRYSLVQTERLLPGRQFHILNLQL